MRINELLAVGLAILGVIFVTSPKATLIQNDVSGEVYGISFLSPTALVRTAALR